MEIKAGSPVDLRSFISEHFFTGAYLMLQSPCSCSSQFVYVLGNGSMLDEGVTHVLSSRTTMDVSGRVYKDDATFLEDMQAARPEVILVNEDDSYDSLRILNLLLSVSSLIGMRVIFISLYNNLIDVYDRRPDQDAVYDRQRMIIAATSNDLVDLVCR
jgi:hypothetical protein